MDSRATLLNAFNLLVDNVGVLSGFGKYPKEQADLLAIQLYDHYLEYYEDSIPDISSWSEISADSDTELKMTFLMAAFSLLGINFKLTVDPSGHFRPLVLDHPIAEYDYEDSIEPFFPEGRLSSSQGSVYRLIALTVFALGIIFGEIGNNKVGFHMLVLSSKILERVLRTGRVVDTDVNSDRKLSLSLYDQITRMALKIDSLTQAVEYGTKLVSRRELEVTEQLAVLTGDEDSTADIEIKPEDVQLDLFYDSLMLLTEGAEKSEQYRIALDAQMKALELFNIERRISKEHSIMKFIMKQDVDVNILNHENQVLQMKLCLNVVSENEKISGDSLISLKYARFAMEHFSLIQGNGDFDLIPEYQLQFLTGVCLYKYALFLAGGSELASSPPIAIRPPGANTPTIRSLLEESLDLLEQASASAESGCDGPDCQEAILVQLAMIAMELRFDDKAAEYLKESGSDRLILTEWDAARNAGTELDTHSHLTKVVYSNNVFKRVLVISKDSGPLKRLTLSRKPTFNADLPPKIQCSYCSMQCANSDLKCEFVYGVLVPTLPAIATRQNISTSDLGLVMSSYSVGIVVTPVVAIISDTWGNRKIPMVVASFVLAFAMLLFAWGNSMEHFLIARMIQGIVGGVSWMIGFSMLAESFPTHLGKVMGSVMTANTLGNLAGPPMGGLFFDYLGELSPLYLCFGVCLLDTLFRLVIVRPIFSWNYEKDKEGQESEPFIEHQETQSELVIPQQVGLLKIICNPKMLITLFAIIVGEAVLTGIY
ncbi:hypothetical protein HDV02_002991 [Globomyces sp. JEL0801]|nr:hypothetical protein HDV02_002991 [Globomyces sp. JEL0801]